MLVVLTNLTKLTKTKIKEISVYFYFILVSFVNYTISFQLVSVSFLSLVFLFIPVD